MPTRAKRGKSGATRVHITATAIRLRVKSPSGDWALVDFRADGKEFTAVGNIVFPGAGVTVEMDGVWETHAKYGLQFKAISCYQPPPMTPQGLQAYLIDRAPGIGPKLAAKLMDRFGMLLKDVLELNPQSLTQVPGITAAKAEKIGRAWAMDFLHRTVSMFLYGQGITEAWHSRIIDFFGMDQTIQVLQHNPYLLTQVPGIAFRTADEMAQKAGFSRDAPQRIESAVEDRLQIAAQEGHCYVDQGVLIEQVKEIHAIEADDQRIMEAIDQLILDGRAKAENISLPGGHSRLRLLYLPRLYRAEVALAQAVKEKIASTGRDRELVLGYIHDFEIADKIELSERQKHALFHAFLHKLSIMTGPPGTGKTQTIKAMVYIAERLGLSYQLAAPTGRAARRIAEVTHRTAMTMHLMLGYGHGNEFRRDRANPIDKDLIIIDEASMPDLELASALFQATADRTSVVLVGDPDQLPAVGPGTVLKSLLASGKVPTTMLDTIFRQAERSLIVQNAHHIRQGQVPGFLPKGTKADSYLIEIPRTVATKREKAVEDVDWLMKVLKIMVAEKIPEYMADSIGFNPIRDIQVMAPMKMHSAGVHALNQVLRETLNPQGEKFQARGVEWRVGDRIMQTTNDYELDISNGDIGFIRGYNLEEKTVSVEFYNRTVELDFAQMGACLPAYCSTIHKLQGAESPVTIIVMLWQHRQMLTRNLLYTANTRARELAIYMVSSGVLHYAVENNAIQQRDSFLTQRLNTP